MCVQLVHRMYVRTWKRKSKNVFNEWETGSRSLREESDFNVSLLESNGPGNVFRHEALRELINMTHSLKRGILNGN
jgi:hypothetical protein